MTLSSRSLHCLLFLAFAGCSTTPQETFYTLNAAPTQSNVESFITTKHYTVAMGPVQVPELVDRPQLVVRKGANQLAVLEQHRWAQSLDAEIAQALSADLLSHLPHARIVQSRDVTARYADYRIAADIVRFDAALGIGVVVQVNWTISPRSIKTPITGQSVVREPVSGTNYDAVAAAFSRALAQVSKEIAGTVMSFQSSSSQSLNGD